MDIASMLRSGFCVLMVISLFPVAGCTQDLSWSVVNRMIRSEFPDVFQISTDSLAALLSDTSAGAPLLLDTRPEEEYAVSHLRGAIRIDPEAEQFSALDSLDRNRPIVTYCSVGYRSSAVAARLAAAGFTNVANLEGSIFRWANEGREVVRARISVREVHPHDRIWGTLLDRNLRAYKPAQ